MKRVVSGAEILAATIWLAGLIAVALWLEHYMPHP